MKEPTGEPHASGSSLDVAGAYDAWAASYDADRNPTRDLDAYVVQNVQLEVAGRDVLELGCGTGKNTVWLAGLARSILALDFSPGMLARARERVRAASVRFVRHDVRDPWPVRNRSFDIVIGNLILEHIEEIAPVYAEAARVLRAGGSLLLCELHPERQRRGGQAHFTDPSTGATVHVAAHRHTVAEYVNGGIGAGLVLRRLDEWLEPEAPPAAPPRLISLLFEREQDGRDEHVST